MGNSVLQKMSNFALCQRYPIYITECVLNLLGGVTCIIIGVWLLKSWNSLNFDSYPHLLNVEQEAIYETTLSTLYYSLLIIGVASVVIGLCMIFGSVETCTTWNDGPCA